MSTLRFQLFEPFFGHLRSAPSRGPVNGVKSWRRAEILRHRDGLRDVQHGVPPPVWDKHNLTSILYDVKTLRTSANFRPLPRLRDWIRFLEPRD